MARKFYLIVLFFVIFLSALPAFADRPLVTEDIDILTPGDIELEAGVEYLANPGIPFSARQVNRGFIRLPALGLNIGLGKIVELQANFDMIYLEQDRIDKTYDNGDLRLWTKIKARQEGSSFPGLGVRIGTKLPNASTGDNRGTDEADFFILMLFSKHFDNVYAHLNLGLGILGDPNQRTSQDDVMVYAAALEIPLKSMPIELLAEVYGQAFSREHNNISSAKCGIRYEIRDNFIWDLFGAGGLTSESEDWSAGTGFTYRFQAFGFSP